MTHPFLTQWMDEYRRRFVSNVELQPDGFDHVHGFVRSRFPGTLGALVALVVVTLHLPLRWAIVSGSQPHAPECTPGLGGVAAGIVGESR